MAYREIAMWEILEVLRRLGRGEKQLAIARVTGHSRMTRCDGPGRATSRPSSSSTAAGWAVYTPYACA